MTTSEKSELGEDFVDCEADRADISCNTIAANVEKANVQTNAKPKLAPALLAVVTAPDPMNAAVMSRPGPIFLKRLSM